MSAFYKAVNWNRQKFIYDGLLAGAVAGYLGGFTAVTLLRDSDATLETALIRALGTAAFVLLTIILAIGPLARFDPRFLPMLYNRRHLGVTMCLLAVAHAGFTVIQFHALGNLNPFVSLLTGSADARHASSFPFELLGLLALVIVTLMAATSHDFWLAFLDAPVWKAMHMLVYVAYGLLVAHVALGSLQSATSPLPALLLITGATAVFGLQIAAGWRERTLDRDERRLTDDGWVDVCAVGEIRELRATMATVGGERIAVFKYDGKVSCVSNVCRHQNGPLGEGKIVDGCITCPWHGYQYLPENGQSPPPFTEKVATYNVQVRNGRIYVHPRANSPGTRVEPARIEVTAQPEDEPFYVGYHPVAPAPIGSRVRTAVSALLVLALGSGIALAATQGHADPGVFEYGHLRTLHGQIREFPYPSLLVPASGVSDREAAYTRYLLVASGKHGAQTQTAGLDGQWVDLRGTRIARGERQMLELAESGVTITPPAPNVRLGIVMPAPVSLGRMTLRGEIVDGKCWLGVMKPATGGVHRGCATRCVSGGIPPLLMTTDESGKVTHYLLADADGRAASALFAEFVGRRVELTGEVIQDADLALLRVERTVLIW
jgi:nitrite reductase/ring-hydroxylating ferredoxin subunit